MLSEIISNYKMPDTALVDKNGKTWTTSYMYLYFKLI